MPRKPSKRAKTKIVLANGSTIRAKPANPRNALRGYSATFLSLYGHG